ncbi:RNA polymerase sigma factor [Candidatus Aminicenantes bacterium AH-873-B07]|jgi:RNA polymerase sigma-70 factor (ECF subfamily)|nr:RNA polymerase sigma factor [Candidatus Aminicenantes bacterium AH-873-B07]
MQDKEIISRCLKGEIETFEMLVKKYETHILSFTWNILGNREEAEDATQETFIQAYLNLNRFDMKRNFKNWLYSIAYKRCLDRKRKEKSFFRFIKKFISGEKSRINIEKKRIEYSEKFAPLLSKLNEKERTAIILKINEGYSAKEIAEVLNCAESTVRVHLFNAKRKLKKLLEEKNV